MRSNRIGSLEEGSPPPMPTISSAAAQRRGASTLRQRAESPPYVPIHAPSPSSSQRLSLSQQLPPLKSSVFHQPMFFGIAVTFFFLLFLAGLVFGFIHLRRHQLTDHASTVSMTTTMSSLGSDKLLTEHPGYQQLKESMAVQYTQLMSLAKEFIREDSQWQEFQTRAANLRLNSDSDVESAIQPQSCPLCSVCESKPCPVCEPKMCPPPPPCPAKCDAVSPSQSPMATDYSRGLRVPLLDDDMAVRVPHAAPPTHSWSYCANKPVSIPWLGDFRLCDPSDFRLEQWFEKQQFVLPNNPGDLVDKPRAPQCIHAPPAEYQYPMNKYNDLPATVNTSWMHWPNHNVMNHENLTSFNYGYTKNLYHFDAPFYDREQLAKLQSVAKVIPFRSAIRNVLDIGAGGGSLGLLLKRMYDIQTLSLVYAELPYCEYITERGGLCAYITGFWSMPFAKHSYDSLHISWLLHMFSESRLTNVLMEYNRVLRPAGYFWFEGGFSRNQQQTVMEWSQSLGYQLVWEQVIDTFDKTKWGNELHEIDWTAVFVKPGRSEPRQC